MLLTLRVTSRSFSNSVSTRMAWFSFRQEEPRMTLPFFSSPAEELFLLLPGPSCLWLWRQVYPAICCFLQLSFSPPPLFSSSPSHLPLAQAFCLHSLPSASPPRQLSHLFHHNR